VVQLLLGRATLSRSLNGRAVQQIRGDTGHSISGTRHDASTCSNLLQL
jgi:hypothetical protein